MSESLNSVLLESELKEEILRLKREKDALILAHNYQRPEIQDMADYTGDSLELSRLAAKAAQKTIVFCGVKFMAETAAILAPEKTVLLPVLEAGCALADTATAEQVRRMKEEYPGAVVVTYVNSSAEVKAESDLCCTSANAVEVVRSVDPKKTIIFVSDKNLGHYAAHAAGRYVILWDGQCPTHAALSAVDVMKAKEKYPDAIVMAHPECRPEVLQQADEIASTSGMLACARSRGPGTSFIVATEVGILHRLKKENPEKSFYPAAEHLVCPTMKMITLADLKRSLKRSLVRVVVDEAIRLKAKRSLDAMLATPPAAHPSKSD